MTIQQSTTGLPPTPPHGFFHHSHQKMPPRLAREPCANTSVAFEGSWRAREEGETVRLSLWWSELESRHNVQVIFTAYVVENYSCLVWKLEHRAPPDLRKDCQWMYVWWEYITLGWFIYLVPIHVSLCTSSCFFTSIISSYIVYKTCTRISDRLMIEDLSWVPSATSNSMPMLHCC